jgi:hypothetical protein
MNLKIKPLKLAKAVLAIGFLMNKKILYLILFFLISSCSNSYQIEKDKADVVPAWFLVKDDKFIDIILFISFYLIYIIFFNYI